MHTYASVEQHLAALDACAHEFYAIGGALDRLQQCIDEIGLRMYANVPEWVVQLDAEVE